MQKHPKYTSFCNLIDNISDLAPSSENPLPTAFSSQAPRSLAAFPKSDNACPSSSAQAEIIRHYSFAF